MDRPDGNKKAKRNRIAKPNANEETQPQILANQASQLRVTERIAEQALERMVELSVLMIDTTKLDERSRDGIEAAKDMINGKHEAARGV
ncbi:uncharacterized protein MELLADRAFT_52939 [Melampsora larici-populina 98AG31]|uniref:Uncharacterized protein n=1 Tax=Melampsora larici-populina (strain 98AG31 / pathotype 3-4-7) TaxID=747676 RepID=F4RRY5_MELLP|nr:uncharacterized protein MELLADRAFT_52939 [Melampsora larici-populina 98AG31]EGG04760.1 hypothetical protein MELLADRAFT_52939 [Melampsora larici-populina 98AG31]